MFETSDFLCIFVYLNFLKNVNRNAQRIFLFIFFAQNCFLGDVTKYHTNFYGISRFFPLYSNFVKYTTGCSKWIWIIIKSYCWDFVFLCQTKNRPNPFWTSMRVRGLNSVLLPSVEFSHRLCIFFLFSTKKLSY